MGVADECRWMDMDATSFGSIPLLRGRWLQPRISKCVSVHVLATAEVKERENRNLCDQDKTR